MATEETNDFPSGSSDHDAFPTREQIVDAKRPDPLDFDEPNIDDFALVEREEPKSGAPDTEVDDADAKVIQDLTKSAKELGMQDDEVAQIKDPGALRSVVAALQRQARVETRDEPITGQTPDAGASPSSEYEALAALDPDDAIDPAAIKAIKALKAELDKMRVQRVQTPAASDVRAETADYQIAKLGEEFVDLFGDGPTHTLPPRSEQRRARLQVVEEMKRIQDSARSAKRKVPTDTDAFDQALRSVFGDKVKQAERRQLASQVKARESQLISRPVNNGKRQLSGRDQAIASVSAILRSRTSR